MDGAPSTGVFPVGRKRLSTRGTALVTGVGPGLGASICRRLVSAGFSVAALARSSAYGARLADDVAQSNRFRFYACDVTKSDSVNAAADEARSTLGEFSVLVHNASTIHIASFMETTAQQFEDLWRVTCLGAVNSAQAVLPDLLTRKSSAMIFTGATASLRGGASFSAFASAKFALRGLSQSLAREFGPKGVHVAHVNVDGLIWSAGARDRFDAKEDECLQPDAIADQYLSLIDQDRSAWTQELDLRPYSESF